MATKEQSIYIDSDFQSSSTNLYPSRHGLFTESVASDEQDGDEDGKAIAWVKSWWFKRLVQFSAFASLVSLSMNTPETFKWEVSLKYVTLALDFAVAFVFTAEMAAQMRNFGLFKKQNLSYFRRPQCIFNASMVLFIWLSIVLHLVEIAGYKPERYVAFSIPRAPRVFVMLRVFKLFVNFKLPESVARRCKQQIWSVTIFFTYFMALAAIIGTQIFGQESQFCVRNGTDVHNVTYSDLLISSPSHCSSTELGFYCPEGFLCETLENYPAGHHFDNFFHSLLTVYESSTQEGWVLVMYEMMGFRTHAVVILYFSLLIFFVAWLVKNVFIAVVSETFADIRSQYSLTKWRIKRRYTGLSSQVIKDEGAGWHLMSVDHEVSKGHAPFRVRNIVFSVYFKYAILACVLVDALIPAINVDTAPWTMVVQLAFTFLFDVEALLKIWCVGFRSYLKSRMNLIEFVLAVGSTIFSIPLQRKPFAVFHVTLLQSKSFAVFHVTRIVRLVDAVPSLKEFCQRVLGTGKKLGSVVLFTLFFVMVSSALSVQLFLTLEDNGKILLFGTYPKALQSMFQIITQEGWVEILETMMRSAGKYTSPLVAMFIVAYNLFSSLIIMSVFVAIIVDNLELEEEVKTLKQKKLGEESKETKEKLPVRLRVFEKFRDNPRLVEMDWVRPVYEFSMPKIRESFLKHFVGSRSLNESPLDNREEDQMQGSKRFKERRCALPAKLLNSTLSETSKVTKFLRQQSSISALISDSYNRRNAVLLPSDLSPGSRLVHTPSMLASSRRLRTRPNLVPRSPNHEGRAQDTLVRNMTRSPSEMSGLQSQLIRDGMHGDLDVHSVRERREEAQRKRVAQVERLRENHPFFDQPLFVHQRDSWSRRCLQGLVHSRHAMPLDRPRGSGFGINMQRLHRMLASQTYLEWVMIMITLASSIAMMLERPDKRTFQDPLNAAFEYTFIVSMTIELCLRILADGLVFTPNAVVQSFGGVLDVFIYLVGLVYVCWQPDNIPARSGTQALLVLRCLRPLRILTLVPDMRQVILELVTGYKEILKVTALQFLLMFVFASYGVQVFSGNLSRCNDVGIKTKELCVGTFSMPLALPRELRGLSGPKPEMVVPRVWKNPRNFSFDNLLNAFLALFEALTLEGWLEMRDVIRESKVGASYSLYVHIYVLLGGMVGLTLFVGVVVTNFNENKGIALLTVDQRRWQDLKKRLRLSQPLHVPPRPDNGLRTMLFDVIQSKIYKRIIVTLILIDCVTLAVAQWISAGERLRDGLIGIAVACSLLFVADAILKIVALTFRGYWHSRRNRFDFLLACVGVLWIILNFALKGKGSYEPSTAFGASIIVFRFLTLSGKHAVLKSLMLTVVMSLVKSFFIIAVLVVLIICYALAGCVLFGTVKYGEAINRSANLGTSFDAMILLFRITTGEDWNKIMHDCMIQPPHCTTAENFWESDCGNEAVALVYFISFYVIITFVFLNLFIAVIIENFSLFYSSDEDSLISNTDLRDFQLTWNVVDKCRRGVLTVRQARLVLRLLRGRLEVDSGSLIFKYMCCEIEKLRGGGDVSFHDVLSVLAYNSVDDIRRFLQLEELLEREELECAIEEEVAIQTIRDWFIRVRQKRAERHRLQLIGRSSPLDSSFDSASDIDERRSESSEEDDSPAISPRDPNCTLLAAISARERSAAQTHSAQSRRVAVKDRKLSGQRKRSGSVTFPAEVPNSRRGSVSEPSAILRSRKSVVEIQEGGLEVRHWWNDVAARSLKKQTNVS